MKRATIFALGVAAITGAAAAVAIYVNWNAFVPIAAMGINYVRYLNAPAGKLTVETAPGFDGANSTAAVRSSPPDDGLWPSYNKTLDSNRFSSLNKINRENADRLKVLCTYDTHQYTGFNSGLLMVDGALLFATDHDTYSIDPITCREKWHKHESYAPATPQAVNRGVAYLDGRVFRGTQDGRVLAFDFKSGERLWEAAIGDPKKSESAPAAPIAWNGLVFIGNAGGDFKGVKGRMYALDAATGRIVWEFYLVPKQPGDPTRGPQGARRSTPRVGMWLAARRSRAARPGLPTRSIRRPGCSMFPAAIRRPISPRRCEAAPIFIRIQWWFSTPKPEPIKLISSSRPRTGTTGTFQPRPRLSRPHRANA